MTDALARIGTYLDNSHYLISGKRAGMLCKEYGGLPRHGYERKVLWEGIEYWISRTQHQNKQVWTARKVNVGA